MRSELEDYLERYGQRVMGSTARRMGYQMRRLVGELEAAGFEDWKKLSSVQWLDVFEKKRRQGLGEASVRQLQGCVKGFYRFLVREGVMETSPICWEVKRGQWTPKHVPRQRTIAALLDQDHGLRLALRDAAVLELLYGTGLRARELLGLNLRDLDGTGLRVVGKGNRERRVPVGRKARERIEHYLVGERQAMVLRHNPLEEALFVGRGGKRLGYGGLRHLLMKRRGNQPITLHSFRHACATHMLEEGASVVLIQRLLGHRKLSSTEIYTRVKPNGLGKMLAKYHPRA